MATKLVKVLVRFLLFARIFQRGNAHNMIALILDPRFKGLTCVCEFVGQELTNSEMVVNFNIINTSLTLKLTSCVVISYI